MIATTKEIEAFATEFSHGLDLMGAVNYADYERIYTDQGLTPMRARWDLFWRTPRSVRDPVSDRLRGYSDKVMDTLIRAAIKMLES